MDGWSYCSISDVLFAVPHCSCTAWRIVTLRNDVALPFCTWWDGTPTIPTEGPWHSTLRSRYMHMRTLAAPLAAHIPRTCVTILTQAMSCTSTSYVGADGVTWLMVHLPHAYMQEAYTHLIGVTHVTYCTILSLCINEAAELDLHIGLTVQCFEHFSHIHTTHRPLLAYGLLINFMLRSAMSW